VSAAPRVVSLVPSVTETLLAWGVTPVACTRFCEQPALLHVGGTKNPDVSAIVELAPDLVVMCIEENRGEDAEALAAAGVHTAALSIDGLGDVLPGLRMLAGLLGFDPDDLHLDDAAWAARAGEGDRAGATGGHGAQDGAPAETPGERTGEPAPLDVSVFVPIWKRPWMTISGGTYGSSLLAALGARNVFADARERYPTVTLDEARERRPDVVLAPSEPYPFAERHVPLLDEVAPVVLVDGQDLFWWGVRTPAAMRRLRHQLSNAR
jgi:ABC-type Fe3+-hydroxamate transport system substrate-binding protein